MNLDWNDSFKTIILAIETTGNDYAEKKATSYYLQELRTSILSSIINKSDKKSVAKAEHEAKGSEDYRQHLKETAEAIERELKAKAKYEKAKAQFEAMRSLISLEKKTQNDIGQ